MTYAVLWSPTSIQQLTRLTAAAADPDSVRQAAGWIDYALRRVPQDLGESRSGAVRVWYGDVLGVLYKVDDAAMKVQVLLVGPARRR
jgi:hypothetical protein